MRSILDVKKGCGDSRWVVAVGVLSLCVILFAPVYGSEKMSQNPTVSISGSVLYYQGDVPVDSVELVLSGGTSDPSLTDADGHYQFSGLETGLDYTVTPFRGEDDAPVSAFDASYILRFLCNISELDADQIVAADVTDDGSVTAFDGAVILRYVVFEGQLDQGDSIGQWSFRPDSIMYTSLSDDQTDQDYAGIIIGDVSGNWRQPTISSDTVTVRLPELSAYPGRNIRVGVHADEMGGLGVLSAQCGLTYDESVLEIATVSHEGTICEHWGIRTYAIEEGKVSLAWAGYEPLEGSGPMVYIDFEVSYDAQIEQTLPLQIEYFMFNEGNPWAETMNGAITIVSAPDITVSDTTHDFGSVEIFTPEDWTLTVSNVGNEDLVVTDISSDTSVFTVNKAAFTIPPEGSENITVTFVPLIEGFFRGSLTIHSNDSDDSEMTISLLGTGLLSYPPIEVDPMVYDFGQVAVHGLADKTLTIYNLEDEEVDVFEIYSDNPDFTVDKTTFTLQPDGSEQVTVMCAPAAEGITTALLLIFVNDPDEPVVSVILSAVGVAPDAVVSVSGGSGTQGSIGNKMFIDLNNSMEVGGVQLIVNFNPDVITATGISSTSRSVHVDIFSANLSYGPGQAKLLISRTTGESIAPGTGSVAEFTFDIDADALIGTYSLTLSDVIVADNRGNPLLVGILNGTVDITSSTGVEDRNPSHSIPEEFALLQNHPNPFNATTDVKYQIVDSRFPVHTSLKIYNVLGQEVRTLVDEYQEAGFYSITWDGRDDQGNGVPSGVYSYRLSVNGGRWVQVRKMVLVR